MKSFSKILLAVRNFPEEIRKLLAIFFLSIAAVLLFNHWTASVSSGLTLPVGSPPKNGQQFSVASVNPIEVGEKTKPESLPNDPAPLSAIVDSFQSLEKLIKSPSSDSVGETNTNVKQKINNLGANLYEGLEKIWNFKFKLLWPI